jgi:hypothetical protein
MTTITLDEIELEAIIEGLRILGHTSVLVDLPPELSKAMAPMIAAEIMNPLKPAQIDDLIDRLKLHLQA